MVGFRREFMKDTARTKAQIALAVLLAGVAVVAGGVSMFWTAGPAASDDRDTDARVTARPIPTPSRTSGWIDPNSQSEFTFDHAAVPTAGDAFQRVPLKPNATGRTLASSAGRTALIEPPAPRRMPSTLTERVPSTGTNRTALTVAQRVPSTVAERAPSTVTERVPSTGVDRLPLGAAVDRPRLVNLSPKTPTLPKAPQARVDSPRSAPRAFAVADARPTAPAAAAKATEPANESPRATVRATTPAPTVAKVLASASTTPLRDATRPTPVWVSLAGVAPHIWPLHAWAPPRRGEPTVPEIVPGDDQLPPFPLHLARTFPSSETFLAQWLELWVARVRRGELPKYKEEEWDALAPPVQRTSLSSVTMAQLGRAVALIDGDAAAALWYAASAERFAALRPVDRAGGDLTARWADAVTRPLNDAGRNSALVNLYACLVEATPPHSDEGRKVRFVSAEMLWYARRPQEALAILNRLPSTVGPDFTTADEREFRWIRGLASYDAEQQYATAATDLRLMAEQGDPERARQAWPYLISALAKAGRRSDATDALARYIGLGFCNAADVIELASVIEGSEHVTLSLP